MLQCSYAQKEQLRPNQCKKLSIWAEKTLARSLITQSGGFDVYAQMKLAEASP